MRNGEHIFDNIEIFRTIAFAIVTTNLTLAGIYAIPNAWWGILIKIILAGVTLLTLRSYFRDPVYWKGIGPGMVLNTIWFSGIWFSGIWFYPLHWPSYIFSFVYVTSIGTMVHMLKRNKEQMHNDDIEFLTKKAIKHKPDNPELYCSRGAHYAELGKQKEAIENFTHAIKLDPSYVLAYYNRGRSYHELREYKRAIEDYTQAIKYKSNDAESYYNRGLCYKELCEYDKADRDYTQAIKYRPDLA